MRDQHGLADYEQAARAALRVRGADPEARLMYKHPEGYAVGIRRPAWMEEAEELRLLDYRTKALAMWGPK